MYHEPGDWDHWLYNHLFKTVLRLHCKLQPSALSASTVCCVGLVCDQHSYRSCSDEMISADDGRDERSPDLWFPRLISRPVVSLAGTRAPISCQLVQLFHAFQTGQLRKAIPLRTNQSCQPTRQQGRLARTLRIISRFLQRPFRFLVRFVFASCRNGRKESITVCWPAYNVHECELLTRLWLMIPLVNFFLPRINEGTPTEPYFSCIMDVCSLLRFTALNVRGFFPN